MEVNELVTTPRTASRRLSLADAVDVCHDMSVNSGEVSYTTSVTHSENGRSSVGTGDRAMLGKWAGSRVAVKLYSGVGRAVVVKRHMVGDRAVAGHWALGQWPNVGGGPAVVGR